MRTEDEAEEGAGARGGNVTGLAFSSLFSRDEEAEAGLAALFQDMDRRMKARLPSATRKGECASWAREAVHDGGAPPREGKRQVHTGNFLAKRFSKDWQEGARKLRLGIMSFLTTQDLNHTQLNFWVDVRTTNPTLQEALAPLKDHPDFKRSVSVRTFDAAQEFRKLSPTHGEALLREYKKNTVQLPTRSDLERIVLLQNYGGIWMDTDVLMIQDLSPLFGSDWAYLGGLDNFINNAMLSASKPQSPFMSSYLVRAAAGGLVGKRAKNIFRYGPLMLRDLYHEIGGNGTFHLLPTCFFDGGWSGARDAVGWDGFFAGKATEKQVAYVTPGNQRHNAFAYHWHGRWERPIEPGSVADRAEQLYAKRLGISLG